jgi:hypothetical protein
MMRNYGYFPIYEHLKKHDGASYDGCYDCALEIFILVAAILNLKDLDTQAVVDALKYPEIMTKVLEFKSLIDRHHKKPAKCLTHGPLTNIPRDLYFYIITPDNHLLQWSVLPDKKIVSNVMVKNGKLVGNLKDFRIAKNLEPITNDVGKFMQWLKYVHYNE